ncbi:uncharacterized protein LOC131009708 [Salvia miltiorrhiza]|uniref:uncharacterized protein LOC131009708 n=1 Tax=Salvia miltiorrhiza TaxID=226208 RepID=UPI0025ACAD02|nr:uncharacterized protein LOC131009708 [Salvia miltiorrhiza]
MAGGGGSGTGTGTGGRKYSCKTATETLEWIHGIIGFLARYRFFLDAHVVNFFKNRLWEAVDGEWMDCLRKEPVEKLLQIPSGMVQGCRAETRLKAAGLKRGCLAANNVVVVGFMP